MIVYGTGEKYIRDDKMDGPRRYKYTQLSWRVASYLILESYLRHTPVTESDTGLYLVVSWRTRSSTSQA